MKVLFLLTERQPRSARLRVLNCLPAYRDAGIEPAVIPTRIDAGRYKVKEYSGSPEKVIIGWIGVGGWRRTKNNGIKACAPWSFPPNQESPWSCEGTNW